MWVIEDRNGDLVTERKFELRESAQDYIDRYPPFFREQYRPAFRSGDSWTDRVLTEGLLKQDLDGILLPQVSIDEYVPADPNTDNVVLAFFIKGVPEAVVPFKNFCEKCNGVQDVDYGDSETVQNTSIIYVEMDRETLKMDDIRDLMIQVCMLTSFEVEDFTMTFPHTEEKFPYNLDIMAKYFRSRDERKNRLAQKKAEKEAAKELQQELIRIKKSEEQSEKRDEDQQNESFVNRLAMI